MNKEFEPSIKIPNNIAPKDYPQKFVYSNEFPHTPKSQGKEAPSKNKVLGTMIGYKSSY